MKKSLLLCVLAVFALSGLTAQQKNEIKSKPFAKSFGQGNCTFSTTGKNQFFVLEPGYTLILEGKNGKESTQLAITVLKETKKIGNVETRIVEEKETVNGKLSELSKNYYAFCRQTGDIYYFGEEVDIYKNGKIKSHSGAWIAEGRNKPGLAMPGKAVIGAKYYQELAPKIAMDRAEIISLSETLKTPAGSFKNCLKTKESNALNPIEKEYKIYAPGIGLIKDESLLLIKYGFLKK
ncbi:MAG: hypothetical protein Q8910_11175 [Bacteroidota bacterium]|nr:hypothetical protein [Bacteroidota bacterium]